jgi:hypothetical protein
MALVDIDSCLHPLNKSSHSNNNTRVQRTQRVRAVIALRPSFQWGAAAQEA